jgi:hypothetical protein
MKETKTPKEGSLYAWVGAERDGTPTLISIVASDGTVWPLVSHKRETLELPRAVAIITAHARDSGHPVFLREYRNSVDLRSIGP